MNHPRTINPIVHTNVNNPQSETMGSVTREERLYKAINEFCFHDESGTCHDCIFRRERMCPVACIADELAKAMNL